MSENERGLNHCTRHGSYDHGCAWCRAAEQSMASLTNTNTIDVLADAYREVVEARNELATMLLRRLVVALTDGYGEQVADEAAALIARVAAQSGPGEATG
jgi:hypothetical protein